MQSANYKLSHNYGTLKFWDYTDLNGMDFKRHGYMDLGITKKRAPKDPLFRAQ